MREGYIVAKPEVVPHSKPKFPNPSPTDKGVTVCLASICDFLVLQLATSLKTSLWSRGPSTKL